MTASTIVVATTQRSHWRIIAAVVIGNALGWFDSAVYGYLALTIAKLFFPTGDEAVSLLFALGTFGVTFFVRPLGAIVIGNIADRHGRRIALQMTILLVMAGSAIMAFVPTFASIGFLAPVLAVVSRIIQGFAAGGEFGTATVFLAEQNPQRRGFFASWQFASQALAAIVATAFGAALTSGLTPDQLDTWGWRIPFIFALLMSPLAYFIRRHLDETREFQLARAPKTPVRETLSNGKGRVLIAFGLVVFGTVANYTILFMPTYAAYELGVPLFGGYLAGLITAAIQMALIPAAGALSDRIGRLPIAIAVTTALFIASYPLFYYLAAVPTFESILLVQLVIGVLVAGYGGAIAALMSELFATQMRTIGVAVSYALGVAIFGGLAPFINTALIELSGSKLAPAFYLMIAAVTSLAALAAARRLGLR
jgi:MHS family proline/betaine transporter-like MFS transporter